MKNNLAINRALEAIKSCLPQKDAATPIHEPLFMGNEWLYVKECLDSGFVSSVGGYVNKFEEMLAGFTGAKQVVAVVNGTAALHLCLILAGVEPNDEVVVPGLTFVATANAVVYCGGIPHFADIEERTLGLDPFKLESYLEDITIIRSEQCFNKYTGRRLKAAIPVHTFGHPVDLDPLMEVCTRFRLVVVEDAAQSLGSFYKGRHTGNWGRLSAFSFNGNKIVTTGGGGAILTNDDHLAKLARHIATTAKAPHRWAYYHDRVGYNYRLPNINAALGCAQLEQLPLFLEKKRALAARYRQAFSNLPNMTIFQEVEFARSNYWLNVLILNGSCAHQKEALLEETNKIGIETRPAWTLIHQLPMFKQCPSLKLGVAESLQSRIINLPSSPRLGVGEGSGNNAGRR